MTKHPLSRRERLVNEQQKEKGRLAKEAQAERSHRVRRKQLKEQIKNEETQHELERARLNSLDIGR